MSEAGAGLGERRDWTTHPSYQDGYKHGTAHAAGRIYRTIVPTDWEARAAYTAGYVAAAGWSEPEEDES